MLERTCTHTTCRSRNKGVGVRRPIDEMYKNNNGYWKCKECPFAVDKQLDNTEVINSIHSNDEDIQTTKEHISDYSQDVVIQGSTKTKHPSLVSSTSKFPTTIDEVKTICDLDDTWKARSVDYRSWQTQTNTGPKTNQYIKVPFQKQLSGEDLGFVRPVIHKYEGPRISKPKSVSKNETVLIIPDSQHGFYKNSDGELVSLHDESALDLITQVASFLQPDKIVLLGDMLDFASLSRFYTEPGHHNTIQATLDALSRWLTDIAIAAPNAKRYYIEGNHEHRLARTLVERGLSEFLNIRPANLNDSIAFNVRSLLSIPHLLQLDNIVNGGYEYLGPYPLGELWLSDTLQVIHGEKLNLDNVLKESDHSVICGHLHKLKYLTRVLHRENKYRTQYAVCPGSLCKTTHPMPGKMSKHNYQSGFGLVTLLEEGHFIEIFPIQNGTTVIHGQRLVGE